MINNLWMEFRDTGVEIAGQTFNRKTDYKAWFKAYIEQPDENENLVASDLHLGFHDIFGLMSLAVT